MEEQNTYTLLIIFVDETREIIRNVTDYGISELNVFYFFKNGKRSFINPREVRYFGDYDSYVRI